MNIIESKNLGKTYKGVTMKALDAVCFSVSDSGIFGLVGRNGSGKTTLVRILATELMPTCGSAFVNGLDVVKDAKVLRKEIAIVPQEARPIPWMTPRQTVLSYLLWRDVGYQAAKVRADEYLVLVGLEDKADVLNRQLSGGMKRKLMVATVLASEAKVIFLDEPTTGLDPLSRRDFWELLKKISRNHFIFLTTHYLEEAEELAGVIGILDNGMMKGVDSLDGFRKLLKYPYSIRVEKNSEVEHLLQANTSEDILQRGSQLQVLTSEKDAISLARLFSDNHQKIWMEPVSLEDIFLYFTKYGEGLL